MSLNTNPDSPRQKMINLMYIVLMAMLALNVSSDVLNGFSLVDESLSRTTVNSTVQNQSLYDGLAGANERNPEKIGPWFEKAVRVKNMSDSLYTYVDELKLRIVKEADGKNGDVANISNKEDLEAVLGDEVKGEGYILNLYIIFFLGLFRFLTLGYFLILPFFPLPTRTYINRVFNPSPFTFLFNIL